MTPKIKKLFFPFCFLLLNALGLWQGLRIWEGFLQSRAVSDPKMISGPADKKILRGSESLAWQWDRAVVSPSQLGDLSGPAPVRIRPEVPGVFRWVSEKQLRFFPSEPWPAARQLEMDLQMLSTNANRQVFSLRHLSRVNGPPLEVTAVDPFLDPRNAELQVRLRLNAEVDSRVLSQYLTLHDSAGEPVGLRVEETPSPSEFLLYAPWTGERNGELLVRKGLSPLSGKGGEMLEARRFPIRALDRFILTGFEVNQPTFGQGEIELTFSDTPSLQSVMDGLRIEPEVNFSVGEGKWWRRQSCAVTGDFQPGTRYRIRLTEGIRAQNGRTLNKEVAREVIIPQRSPGLKFAHPGGILNASGAKQIELEVENEGALTVELEQVHANNLVEYGVRSSGRDNWVSESRPTEKLGKPVWRERIADVESGSVPLDLSEALSKAGQGVYRLRVTGRNSRRQIEKVVAVSDLGLLAQRVNDELWIWALRLESAEPVADLEVSLWSDTRQQLASGRTDARGLCRLRWVQEEDTGSPLLVLAEKPGSLGLLNLLGPRPFPGRNGDRNYLRGGNEAFVYTGRGLYRPQETVHARAVVRGKSFSLPGEFPVEWRLRDAAGLTVWRKQGTLSDVGTDEVAIPLQPEWPNGAYRIGISLPGEDAPSWGDTVFHLESFVPPQVVVKAETPDGEQAVPERFRIRVDARMLYGAPAAGHEGKMVLTLLPEAFRSSEYPDYGFSDDRKPGFSSWSTPLTSFKTDEQGRAAYEVKVPGDKTGPSALRAVVGISVKEFSGREATTFVSRRVDRVPYYLGLKSETSAPDKLKIDLLGLYPDGKRIQESPALEVAWYRVSWQRGYRRDAQGRYTYFSEEVAVKEGEREVLLEQGRQQLELTLTPNAVYRVAARDPVSGFSTSHRVTLGNVTAAPDRADRIKLALDRGSYAPGEEAVLSLHAPFAGRVLITVEDAELKFAETLLMTERQESFRFRVPESGSGNLWVRATLVRPQPGEGAVPVLRSEGAVALNLKNDELMRPLTLQVAEQLRPSRNAELLLRGEPGAEVVVAGVDEGILLLNDFKTPDPLDWFLALRRAGSLTWDGFHDLLPELGINVFAGTSEMGGGLGGVLRKRLNPVDAKRFKPLSWWSGARRIPADGELRLQMPMPEFNGQIRWMAVQVSAGGMGHAEAFSRVGREVVVQQSLPLFLAPGDETRWSFRIHNRSETSRTVRLIPSVRGPVEVGAGEVKVTLEPGGVLQKELTLRAADEIGGADLTLNVESGDESWSESLELAVRPAEAFEVRVKRMLLAQGQEYPLAADTEMRPGTGRHSLTVVSTPVLQLAGAREYLMRYPYGCLEQTVSAASPALYLPEWSPDAAEGSRRQVNAGITELWKKQRRDGGFGYWNRADIRSVSGSFYALEFLLEAKSQGYDVHGSSLKAGVRWTKDWLLGQQWRTEPGEPNLQIAQACRVLAMAGELDAGWLQRLRERQADLDAFARVVAAEAMMLSGQRSPAMEMLEGLGRVDGSWGWHSRESGNADLLWLLLKLDPRDSRIVPLVEGILERRNRQGRWAHTYENARVLRALTAYAQAWPPKAGGFSTVIVRGGGPAVKVEEGRPEEIPEGEGVGTLINDGENPVYVEIRSEGIPLKPAPLKNSFRVERSLYHLDGREIIGGAEIQSGETLMMRIRVSGLNRSVENMVVDQRLPAGLEPLPGMLQQKPRERLQRELDQKVATPRHLEVRDDRVFLFPHPLDGQAQVFYVLLRAVTPGSYTFPGLFAQDMYDDRMVFRGETERVEVIP